jgi:carbonic anhydrase
MGQQPTRQTFSSAGLESDSHHESQLGELTLPSTGRLAILTCMDAQMQPSRLVGLHGSSAQIIRNAGARPTEEAIRSLVLSHELLGAREWFVVQHSQCGLALLDDELLGDLLPASRHHADVRGIRDSAVTRALGVRSQEQNVVADVARIRSHPLVPANIPIYGYIYHVETGRFVEVLEARPLEPSPSVDTARSYARVG